MSALDLFNKFLKSSISRKEQHDLERYSLDDPFLSDALEGVELYQSHKPINLSLQLLESRRKKKNISIIKLQPISLLIAAGIFLLMAVYFIFTNYTDTTQNLHDTLPPLALLSEEGISAPVDSVSNNSPNKTDNLPGKKLTYESSKSPDYAKSTNGPDDELSSDLKNQLILPKSQNLPSEPTGLIATKIETDENATESVEKDQIVRSFARKIPGQPDTTKINLPAPEIGYGNFRKYLKINSSITREYLFMMNISPQKVDLRFNIDDSGSPKNIEVLNNPDSVLIQEAIKLIKNGPKWTPRNEHQEVNYTIYFPIN